GHALNIAVPDRAPLTSEFRSDLLGGVQVITGPVEAVVRTAADTSVRTRPHRLVAIPYYAWANRGLREMQVWLPRTAEKARATPIVPPRPIATVASSGGIEKKWTSYNDQNDDIADVYDGATPLSSADESNLYFRMRPAVGQPAWGEYDFPRPGSVRASDVSFADDSGFCKPPGSWRLVYKSGGAWKPVVAHDAYAVTKDQFNHVTFAPVTSTAVRIEVERVTSHHS